MKPWIPASVRAHTTALLLLLGAPSVDRDHYSDPWTETKLRAPESPAYGTLSTPASVEDCTRVARTRVP